MSQAQLDLLQQINDEVNAIPYDANAQADIEDIWVDTPTPDSGWECRDYTLRKGKLMRERGWNPLDMGVVWCNDELGEYHAVQFAKCDDDTIMILDNRADAIYDWRTPPYKYTWIYQQIPGTLERRDASSGLV